MQLVRAAAVGEKQGPLGEKPAPRSFRKTAEELKEVGWDSPRRWAVVRWGQESASTCGQQREPGLLSVSRYSDSTPHIHGGDC